ncbi:SAF domain-containing protein [Paenibacillus sp. GCM10027627]|uniref:SAF domain-containing protein n=1 Tax=unclassified Paenibacillus TaxID=185978 RepID=UPI0036432004
MNIEWNWKTIVIIASVVILFVGTNIGQYFVIWKPKMNDMKVAYEQEIAGLNETIERIGPIVQVWAIKDDAKDLFAGGVIKEEDLLLRELPESFVTQSLVINPETIIGKYYRINMLPGTLLSTDMVMEDPIDDTVRLYDIVANVIPIGLKVGDYIDFRIVYPFGEDYIVLSRKRVEAINDKVIKLKMSELEIHYYQASLVDHFLNSNKGSQLYMTKYLEPGIQKAATPYYSVPENILSIMKSNPNITEVINGQNDTWRKIIDSGTANVSKEQGQEIVQGRNDVQSAADAGKTKFETAEKEKQDKAAQEAALNPVPPPAVPTDPNAGSGATGGSQGSTGSNGSTGSGTGTSGGGSSSGSSGTTAPETGGTTGGGDASLPGNPLLEVEKGVVE